MKNKRNLWISLMSVVAIAVIGLSATLAAGWSPKLGLDLDGGLSVVYQTHRPVSQTQLDTIVTILGERVNSGTSGASRGRVEDLSSNQVINPSAKYSILTPDSSSAVMASRAIFNSFF